MVPAADVRRVAPAATQAEAEARLYQAAYGCTMHSAGLLYALAAILDAEAEGRFTLADVAAAVAARCRGFAALPRGSTPSDAWRLGMIAELCDRLCVTSR